MGKLLFSFLLLALSTTAVSAQQYDVVLEGGRVMDPETGLDAVRNEVIGAAAISGASLHIVHINSSCSRDSLECLSMIEGARARGLDVTTEAYPYIAGMTAINSALFNLGWQDKLGISYGNLLLPETGEHLTQERFEALHNSSTPHLVVIFSNTQEAVDQVITHPLVMIASDGAPGHPRNAGTYSHVLAQYVREKAAITLMDALRKMSTYEKPMEPSVGVRYLVVAGSLVVDAGKLVPDVFPGRALRGPGKRL
jgi:hypothetical protein